MSNINNIIYESLGEHFKKHWKKYAAGLGAAALAGGAGIVAHKKYKDHKLNTAIKNEADIQKLRGRWNTVQNLTNIASGAAFGHASTGGDGASAISTAGAFAVPAAFKRFRKESFIQRGLNKAVDKFAKTHTQRKIGTHVTNALYALGKLGAAHHIGKTMHNNAPAIEQRARDARDTINDTIYRLKNY